MSTKSTIAYGDAFHLYSDLYGPEDSIYLLIDNDIRFLRTETGTGRTTVTVEISQQLWDEIVSKYVATKKGEP